MPPSPITSSSETSPIVRKKSGERVKSSLKLPALVRHQSMPAQSKFVHFDVNLEQVRHFLHSEKPAAVSSPTYDYTKRPEFHWGSTDSESETDSDEEEDPREGYQRYLDRTEWHIAVPNFTPPDIAHESRIVYVENIFLTSDKTKLIGHVAVKNLAFEKHVSIKYTLDNWKTITELTAEYNDDVRRKHRAAGYDRFSFAITMADLPQQATTVTKSLFFCVRYVCNNTEYWDNNHGANYQVDFSRVPKHKTQSTSNRLPTRPRRSNSVDNPMRIYDDVLESTKKNEFNSRYDFNDSILKKINSGPQHVESKLALNAKTYQELIDSYCFFKGPQTTPTLAAMTPRSLTPEHMYDHPQWSSVPV